MEYKAHARERMRDRGITQDDVEAAYASRVGPELPGRRPHTRTIQGFDTRGRLLTIVYNEHHEVVTVFLE